MDWLKKKWENLIARTYHGRLNRQRYFLWGIGYNISIQVVYKCLSLLLGFIGIYGAVPLMEYLVDAAYYVADVGVGVLILMGRLHDLNLSAWMAVAYWAVIVLSLIYAAVVSFSGTVWPLFLLWLIMLAVALGLLFKRGTVGENQYGPDPLDEEE